MRRERRGPLPLPPCFVVYNGEWRISNHEQQFTLASLGSFVATRNRTLIGHKCDHVIKAYAELAGIPLREAFDLFYKSNLYLEIIGGISDMHCRSDGYLAEELQLELNRQRGATVH